ncbi:MAG TPA: flippase [Phototrophicaceae bacterium]|nr:flippase [Phototrophicaceae bacterium]
MSDAQGVINPPRRSVGRLILRNTVFSVGAQAALRGLSFLFTILITRTLGDAAFGQYSVVLAWAGLFSFIGDMGVTQYMTREVARDSKRAADLFWDTAALRFILSIAAMIITIGVAALKPDPYEPEVVLAIALYTLSYFLQAVLAPLQSVIAGNERLDILAVLAVLGQIIYMAVGGLFLFAGLNYVWLVVASLVNLPVLIGLSAWAMRRNRLQPPRFHLTLRFWPRLLAAGMPFAMIQVALTFNFQVDTLILKAWQPNEVVGWYNAAYHLTRSLLILGSALIVVIPITLAREHAQNPKSILPWYYRSTKFMAFIGLPLAVGGTLLADKIIRLLYGADYAPAAIAFAILIWDTPLLMYTALCGNLTTSIKKERYSMLFYVSLAALNLILNLIFIPQYGIFTAAVTTVSAELTGALLFYRFFRREFGEGLGFKHMVRLVIAAGLMGVVVYLLRDYHLLINVTVSSVFYLVVVWLIRALTPEERDYLTGLVRRKLGPILRRGRAS